MQPAKTFRRFKAWKACHAFTLEAYAITKNWPFHERFGLTAQLRRASVSAEANLAEGCGKRGTAEFARFLDISVGSLTEAECLIEIAHDLGYISGDERTKLDSLHADAASLTHKLRAAMRARILQDRARATR